MTLAKTFKASAITLLGLASSAAAASVASTYIAGYHTDEGFPVSKMQWEKYTEVKYAFAETAEDGSLNISKSEPDQLPVFVAAAKENNVKALVSIGGWTGSRFFSTSIGSVENRTAFVKTCLDFVSKYELDGLDFDWEYPNRQGLGCNTINENDTMNFLAFLQELRQEPEGANLTLTAAGSLFPWYNTTGASSTNGELAGFADVLDYVMIMAYDIYGAWASTGGPNAPLAYACDSRNNQGGAEEGIAQWVSAGLPAAQIVLGVGAYGHGFSVNASAAFPDNTSALYAYPAQNSSHRFQGSSWDNDPAVDECGNASPPGGTYTFWSLIDEKGFLDTSGNPTSGIAYGYDNCSQTPFIYSQADEIWVSYDNVESLTAKGEYILSEGLAGFALWEAGGDYNNILVDAIRSATGFA